jgi:hypothetical protein
MEPDASAPDQILSQLNPAVLWHLTSLSSIVTQYYYPTYACVSQVVSSLQDFRPKFCTYLSFAYVLYALPIFSSLIYSLIIIHEQYKLWSSSLCNFLQPPVASSLSSPNILLSTLFWNALNLWSFFGVSDQVSHPCKGTGNNIVLYILLQKDKKLKTWEQQWANQQSFEIWNNEKI